MGALALVTDLTESRSSHELIWQQANFDGLTGLPNRLMFLDRLKLETRKADRTDAFLALLFIDLDHFKDINDRLGHGAGDQVLVEASRRIASCVRGTDMLARLGGDEFTVILSGLDHIGSVERIARDMLALLALPFALEGEQAWLSASIGIALYPPDARDLNALVERADQAMYAAKNQGRNRFSYFTPDLQQAAQARQNIAAEMRAGLAAGQFEIAYQPIVSLHTGEVLMAEALLRWRHPVRGLLRPAEFIPSAESNGLIVEIGDWVFRETARQLRQWQASISPAFKVCVNKSPVQFRHDADVYQRWRDYLSELGVAHNSIIIEINESVLLEGAGQVLERLGQYRAMGLQLALDDFGTGYSSLSHLKRFDIDFVKIDQSFIATLEDDDGGDLALCEAIIAMAHKLGLKVVAEGVETQVQRALLVDAGCDYAQGYIFAHPMPADDFEILTSTQGPKRTPIN
jgi:diguanylate cyclase (GGDEF)-like protein